MNNIESSKKQRCWRALEDFIGVNEDGHEYYFMYRKIMPCRVFVVRKPFIVPMTHHVAVVVHDGHRTRTFEHGIRGLPMPNFVYRSDVESDIVEVGETPMTISDIESYERTLPTHYVLGVRDCRHHAADILEFCGIRNAKVANRELTARTFGSG